MFRQAPRFGKDPNKPWFRNLENVKRNCRKAIKEGKDRAFFNSMSDTFWDAFSFPVIEQWHTEIIEAFPELQFQVLTKRIGRAYLFYKRREKGIPKNAWIGTSIGAKDRLFRLDLLRKIKELYPFTIVWVSFEPLLEDLGGYYSLRGIDWAVVGGESGSKQEVRPMNPDWAENIRTKCAEDGCAFFFKQMGGVGGSGAGGELLNGIEYKGYPIRYVEALASRKVAPSPELAA